MTSIYHTLISQPLYNGLIALMHLLPFADVGVIVIVFTIIVKLILLPLSLKASRAQIQMKAIEKDLSSIKEKYKDNKEEQSRQTIQYYKDNNINPLAGILILIIQLPIVIGLYRIFLKSGLPQINTAMLYSFVHPPASVNMIFLHTANIAQKSIILALIAGLTTYFQISQANSSSKSSPSTGIQGDMAKAMAMQMKYFFPVMVTFISYSISGALALYWITSNVFAIVQEIYIKKKYHKAALVV